MHWFEKHEFSKKNHWAPFKVVEVKKSFLRSLRPNFGFHLLFMGFDLKISVVLGFDDLGNLRRPRVENFNSWHFLTFSTNWHFSHKGLMGFKKIMIVKKQCDVLGIYSFGVKWVIASRSKRSPFAKNCERSQENKGTNVIDLYVTAKYFSKQKPLHTI